MRVAVASQCGFRIPDVLAQLPHASLIGEDGDLANCSAVFCKRRSKRLSERSVRANSCLTHSTDSVPASKIA